MSRFTNIPKRLREAADLVGMGGHLDISEALSITGLMRDAALKIEALERDHMRAQATDE